MAEVNGVGLVCFDWGGVILRICRDFAEGVRAAGLEMREGADKPGLHDVRVRLSREFQVGRISERDFFGGVSASFDGLYGLDEIAAIHDAWLLGEYDGVSALVEELLGNPGVETAMLSNTNARHWARRESDFPTAGLVRHQHASHVLRCAKPDTAIYEAFERETGYTGDQIVFFDDLAENIDAASARGWRAVLIDPRGDTAGQMREALAGFGALVKAGY